MSISLVLIQAALSVGIGAVFVASAVPKLHHPRGFVLAVMEYRVLSMRTSWIVGRSLPPLELLVGLMLVSGLLLSLAAVVVIVLLLCFLLAIGVNLARGRDLDCHCFGSRHRRKIGWRLIVEDIGLLLAGGVLVGISGALGRKSVLAAWSPWRLLSFASPPAGLGLVMALVVAALVIMLALALNPLSAAQRAYAVRAKSRAKS